MVLLFQTDIDDQMASQGGSVLSDTSNLGDDSSYIDTLVQLGMQFDQNIYHCKAMLYFGREIQIVTQNHNGPCPLIAIRMFMEIVANISSVNCLALKGIVRIPFVVSMLSQDQIIALLADRIMDATPLEV